MPFWGFPFQSVAAPMAEQPPTLTHALTDDAESCGKEHREGSCHEYPRVTVEGSQTLGSVAL